MEKSITTGRHSRACGNLKAISVKRFPIKLEMTKTYYVLIWP